MENNSSAARYAAHADRFSAVLDAMPGDAWSAATPCADWTVADVVGHVVDSERDFMAKHGAEVTSQTEGGTPVERWRELADQAKAWLGTPGIADQGYASYFGPSTLGATMADFYGWDLAIHTWDVARGAGQEFAFDDAERLLEIAQGWGPAIRSEGICGPEIEVDPDAPADDRLVAYIGRDPRWAPAS